MVLFTRKIFDSVHRWTWKEVINNSALLKESSRNIIFKKRFTCQIWNIKTDHSNKLPYFDLFHLFHHQYFHCSHFSTNRLKRHEPFVTDIYFYKYVKWIRCKELFLLCLFFVLLIGLFPFVNTWTQFIATLNDGWVIFLWNIIFSPLLHFSRRAHDVFFARNCFKSEKVHNKGLLFVNYEM